MDMTAFPTDLLSDPRWVKKIEASFDSLDDNKDGILTIAEVLKPSYKLHTLSHVTPLEITNLEAAIRAFWGAMALTSDHNLQKREFVEEASVLGKAEREKKSKNEPSLIENLCNAYFDIIDINKDGFLSLEELRIAMEASTLDSEGAEAWFNNADANKDGKVDREELANSLFSFWFRPEDESTVGLFGGAYED